LVSAGPAPSIELGRARRLVGEAEALADHADRREGVQLEAFELALALAAGRADASFQTQDGWVDGVRAGLVALLGFFDEEPLLARYLVLSSATAGPGVLARRCEVLDQLAALLDDERAPARSYPPPLTAHAVASGVLGVLQVQLSRPDQGALVDLAGQLMSFTVLPFLGPRAARRELDRPAGTPASVAGPSVDLLQDPGRRRNHHREIEVLSVLAGEPGLNGVEVALRADVKDQGQISRLLARLARRGLIASTKGLGRSAGAKEWRLTAAGGRLEAALTGEAPGAGAVLDLPERFVGRLDYWAVCVLRAIGEQPWLTSKELDARSGINDFPRTSELLEHLAGLGLVASAREKHGKGAPKVWRITGSGEELDRAIGRDAPAPPRSLARDLMWESGGRLSEDAVSVLRVGAVEPGLSNGEIALHVGIADANSMSQLLARLARRGLIENVRDGGRQNMWHLTAGGEALEQAIRDEALVPVRRNVALDVLNDQGGRLNHRVVSVLRLVGAEPGLSNLEIAHHLGVESKAHASRLLARLARFGLIENQVVDPAPFEAHAWRLTRSGQQLAAAVLADSGNDDTTSESSDSPMSLRSSASATCTQTSGLRRLGADTSDIISREQPGTVGLPVNTRLISWGSDTEASS
jgi:DNA-binding MarR family transcriptional regulator